MVNNSCTVVITLTAEDPVTEIPERTITLDYDTVRISVGRASSKVLSVTPKVDNAFFENPVMSRSHAELYADLKYLVCFAVSLDASMRSSF